MSTVAAPAASGATAASGDAGGSRTGLDRVLGWTRRPVIAALLLLAAYVALSGTLDAAGFLGTDTGGKVATLRVMADQGTFVRPDIGYWAAPWDPDARAHGLFYTVRLGDQYVNVTSLPMIVAAGPLWRLGGYRLALLLPMVGAIGAAFVARGIARRARGGSGWPAFWLTGLASPVVVYALDLWEHTLGLACMGAGVLLLLTEITDRSRWWRGLVAGAAFGAGFTMRTESVVYGFVSVGIAVVAVAVARRDLLAAARIALGSVVGFVAVAFANGLLEQAALGQSFRSGRAAGTATAGGSAGALRVREAFATSLTPFPSYDVEYVVLACGLAVALLLWAWSGSRGRTSRVAPVAAAGVGLIFLARLSFGLGFWPGLLATTPLAAVALVRGWARPADRWVLAFALVPLPLVFAFQFPGGALPQWGGRYILTSGLLLGALGAACLPDLVPWVRRGFMVAAVATAVFGVAWLSVRTHQVAAAGEVLDARPEAVLIARDGFTSREFGATYGDRRWLAVGSEADLLFAAEVAARSGAGSFAIVDLAADPAYPTIPGFHETGRTTVDFVDPQRFTVTTFTRDGS